MFISFFSEGCNPRQFDCQDGQCIDIRQQCDGRSDCRNGLDEQNCGTGMSKSFVGLSLQDIDCIEIQERLSEKV